jgi:hypothetical protein
VSSIAGQSLFESGPQRFAVRRVGTLFVPPLTVDAFQTTINVVGPIELRVVQTGRLLAPDDDDLFDQIEDIRAQCEAQLTGVLIDNNGNSWTDMTLLAFTPGEKVDRGRVVSVGYRVDYARLAS